MSLFRNSVRPSPLRSDEAVRRYVAAIRADLEPDPLFRRRLRGTVVNRFVAVREGLEEPTRRPNRMGRLGRACLYASFALALSVGGVMAASRGAMPGDLLYPVKLEIEAIRMRALPAHFQDDLAVFALSERINELGRLAEAGNWEAVAAMAGSIQVAYDELERVGMAQSGHDGALARRLEVLQALVERLPAQAQSAVEGVIERGAGVNRSGPGVNARRGDEPPRDVPARNQRPAAVAPVDVTDEDDEEQQAAGTVKPSPAARPSPRATPTPKPSPTPKAASHDDAEAAEVEHEAVDTDEAEPDD